MTRSKRYGLRQSVGSYRLEIRGNWKDLYYTFGDMLARASEGVTLHPGEVVGSGTVGTGSLLELTGGEGPWLQPGDVVELEIERIGVLRNTVGEPTAATG